MKRNYYASLLSWKKDPGKKPLIIRGARQVGKTYLAREFGKNEYQNFVEINFEKESRLRRLFAEHDQIEPLLKELAVIKKNHFDRGTLLFLDEIQECPQAILKLRYFYEDCPNLSVIAAGSLLEFVLDEGLPSFPVGRVEFGYLFPLTFEEFLYGVGQDEMADYLKGLTLDDQISLAMHKNINQQLKEYFLLGGMPEIVKKYSENKNISHSQARMEALIQTLEEDFRKYRTRFDPNHLELVFRESPKWIGKRLNVTKLGAPDLTPQQTKKAIELLEKARLLYQIKALTSVEFPLIPKNRLHPKLMYLDLGLVQFNNHISEEIILNNDLSAIYQGMFCEQYVAQELMGLLFPNKKPDLYFWSAEKKGANAEVDFVIPCENQVIPIEVKSGKSGRLASLHQYNHIYRPSVSVRIYDGPLQKETVRVSLNDRTKVSYDLISLPLYLVHRVCDFLRTGLL